MEIVIKEIDLSKDFSYYSGSLSLISDSRRNVIDKMTNDNNKTMSLMTELTILENAARCIAVPISTLSVNKTEKGKPYISGYDNFHFSVSHTNNIIAFCVNDAPVGIDIEYKTHNFLRISKRFFTSEESELIENATDKEKAFLQLWTAKESYLKMTGDGLYRSLSSFNIVNNPDLCLTSNDYCAKDGTSYVYSTCTLKQ